MYTWRGLSGSTANGLENWAVEELIPGVVREQRVEPLVRSLAPMVVVEVGPGLDGLRVDAAVVPGHERLAAVLVRDEQRGVLVGVGGRRDREGVAAVRRTRVRDPERR